jgi:cation transport regulator
MARASLSGMPYATNSELPAGVRDHLPPDAQDIYRAAFNSALECYGCDHQGLAQRIAWTAVKRRYMQSPVGFKTARTEEV